LYVAATDIADWDPERDLPALDRLGAELAQNGHPLDGRLVMSAAHELHRQRREDELRAAREPFTENPGGTPPNQ
jgi:hypothetical protein